MKDCYGLCDCGWDGWMFYGPYTEEEAKRRFRNDLVVRLIHGSFEPFYPAGEEPTE